MPQQREGREALPVFRCPVEARRVRRLCLRQHVRGQALERAPLACGDERSGAVQQKRAKQRVILIHGLGLPALDDEAILPMEVSQHLAHHRVAGHPLRVGHRHRRQERGAQQGVLHRRVEAPEELAREIIEQQLLVLSAQFRQVRVADFGEQQGKTCDPSLGFKQQVVDSPGVRGNARMGFTRCRKRKGFVPRKV